MGPLLLGVREREREKGEKKEIFLGFCALVNGEEMEEREEREGEREKGREREREKRERLKRV